MRRPVLAYALALSLLFNLGVLGAAAYRALQAPHADLARALKLDDEQRRRWEALEADFVRELDAGRRDIAQHRERLVREVFSDAPHPERIEDARARIAELQGEQQRRVIAQFLKERAIIDGAQRRALVELLLQEKPAAPLERQLHGR